MDRLTIRDGTLADLGALAGIEARSFASDRLSPRSLRRFLSAGTARVRVACLAGAVVGYHLILLRSGSGIARLYSIAVEKRARGEGVGGRLLADAERLARKLGKSALRLEVREDNPRAIRLYEQRDYSRIGMVRQYYADKATALRYEKRLGPGVRGPSPDRHGLDPDEDRSPADFGVLNSPPKRSSKPAAPRSARAPGFALASGPGGPPAHGREA